MAQPLEDRPCCYAGCSAYGEWYGSSWQPQVSAVSRLVFFFSFYGVNIVSELYYTCKLATVEIKEYCILWRFFFNDNETDETNFATARNFNLYKISNHGNNKNYNRYT